ncbi:MAG: DUF3089 domain-containing protein [Mycobacteriales bacterium]
MGRSRLLLVGLLVVAACTQRSGTTHRPTPSATPSAPPATAPVLRSVTHPTLWLCRPGLVDNPCEGGLDATVVTTTGATRHEAAPAAVTPVDCFYVYPTVSEAATTNAPLRVTAAEVRTVRAQAARFSSVCRVFAPVYRQLTVEALLRGRFGDASARALSHSDVVSAWHDYLNHNPGRRFVLLGHSQGSFELLRLLQEEIDGDAGLRARLVSALLPGGNLKVPPGRDVGGDLQHVPLCRAPTQIGCVVAYNTYATTPGATALFGRPDTVRHLVAACTNPAALAGGAAVLSPYFPTPSLAAGSLSLPGADRYRTGFVSYPGYVSAACHERGGAAWLQVTLLHHTEDPRPQLPERLGPAWGLHLVDVNIALGDLVSLVRSQS